MHVNKTKTLVRIYEKYNFIPFILIATKLLFITFFFFFFFFFFF